MHSAPVLEHLKKFGQLLDSEIAAATGIDPLAEGALGVVEPLRTRRNCQVQHHPLQRRETRRGHALPDLRLHPAPGAGREADQVARSAAGSRCRKMHGKHLEWSRLTVVGGTKLDRGVTLVFRRALDLLDFSHGALMVRTARADRHPQARSF